MFDDDDLMLVDHIGRLARHIRDGADICSTGFWYADPDPMDFTKLVPRPTPARPRNLDWVTCWPDSSLSTTGR